MVWIGDNDANSDCYRMKRYDNDDIEIQDRAPDNDYYPLCMKLKGCDPTSFPMIQNATAQIQSGNTTL